MKNKLTIKQKLFCQHYVELANATQAVIKAGYDIVSKDDQLDYATARTIASQNLTKLNIRSYIQKLLELHGYNDQGVKVQHLEVINQNKDLSSKLRAIDIYYRLTGAYSATKIEHGASQEVEDALERLHKMLPD